MHRLSALAELTKEKCIIILPADKRKATVVTDTDEYEQKVNVSMYQGHCQTF